MVKTRQVIGIYDDSDESELEPNTLLQSSINQVQIRIYLYIDAFNAVHNICFTIYSGATENIIRSSAAKIMGLKVTSCSQLTQQADSSFPSRSRRCTFGIYS